MSLEVIVLAAGKGTRMRSALPKVLHPLAGRPMLGHVLDCARNLEADRVSVVYGHGGDAVPRAFADSDIRWVLQERQQGTGHAVRVGMPDAADDAVVLIMYGDVPLVSAGVLGALVARARAAEALAILTLELERPGAYGRIVRDDSGAVTGIVEQRDATGSQLEIREINTGFMAAPAGRLRNWLGRIGNRNSQGEYYLTDVVALAVADGVAVRTVTADDPWQVQGVNSRSELAALERVLQQRRAETLMAAGVSLADPARFDLRGSLAAGTDCFLDVNVVFEGDNIIGSDVRIGPNCVIRNARLGDGVEIQANCVIDGAVVGDGCSIGPFARVRPGTELGRGARLGNFVETKNARIGDGSKANHLSYVGDSEVGRGVNIGAGVITCNYDGANKHRTEIGDDAFIGSDCQLVAPVKVGAGATIGAGTTLTRDAPEGQLTVSRSPQRTIRDWQRPKKSG